MERQSLLYLCKDRTLFLGYLDDPLQMTQGAATLCVSLEGKIHVILPDSNESFYATSILIPPGFSIVMDSQKNKVANINLDVMGADFFCLSNNMQEKSGLYVSLKNEEDIIRALQEISQYKYPLNVVKSILAGLLTTDAVHSYPLEKRVLKAVDIIQNTIEENLSIDYLAKQVNLSVSGLTKLFKKQTGVPIRRYRQWHRLFTTATEIGKGRNITEAAQVAGFVDLPHCTHTFNMMLGMKPSYFLIRPGALEIMVDDD